MANKRHKLRKKSKLYLKRLMQKNALTGNIKRLKITSQEDKSNHEVISNPDGDEPQHADSTLSNTEEKNNCAKENLSNQDVVTGLKKASQEDDPNLNHEVKSNLGGDEPQHSDSTLSNTDKKNICAKEDLSHQDVVTGLNPLPLQTGDFENGPKCCIVPRCSRNEVANPELTFFSIPYELRYRKIWCESIGRQDLWHLPAPEMSKYYFCSRHFEEKFFFRFQSKLVLLRNANPTLELPSIKQVEFKSRKFEGKCSAAACENTTKDNPDLKFFYVPGRREVYPIWLRNIGVTRYCKFSLCKFAVCEEHFEKRYIKIDRKGNYVLMPYAEPTLKLPIPYEEIKHIEPADFRKHSLRLATPNEPKSTNSKTNGVHISEKIVNSELQKDAAVEFIDFNKIEENLYDPPAKRKKNLSGKDFKCRGNADELNNDNYFFDDDSNTDDDNEYNTDDPNFVGAEYDSLSEVNIKNEAEDFKSINEEQNAFNNTDNNMITIDNMITPFCEINHSTGEESDNKPSVNFLTISSSLSDSGNVEFLISTNNSTKSTKEKIKTIYENGSEEARLLFDLCDVYCKERTTFKLKLKEEILSDE